MGRKKGALLWSRQQIELVSDDPEVPGTKLVNTGLTQPNTGFGDYSPDEPILGLPSSNPNPPPLTPPDPGSEPASRVQVIPMAPTASWSGVTHSEPFVDDQNVVWIEFAFDESSPPATINVLFWDPHSMVGPGAADTYNAPILI